MKTMKKQKFKLYIKDKVRKAAFFHLLSIKDSHKKGSNIVYEKFEIEPYLKSSLMTYDQKCLLFKLRANMTPVKVNFSSMYEDTSCTNCKMNVPESDHHMLECTKMIELCLSLHDDCETEYLDIVGEIDSQIRVVKIYEEIFKVKKKLEEPKEDN